MERQEVYNMLNECGLLFERLVMAKKRKPERPTKYNPYYPQIAEVFCREDGYTDKQLAGMFGVAEGTINAP